MNISSTISSLPTWQLVFVAIAGIISILSSVYLASQGVFAPLAAVAVTAFLIWLTWSRMQPAVVSKPPAPEETPSQYDVFREMESADQTRVNPWVGFLQEDVYAKRTGPIGTFVGNDDYVKNAPLYPLKDVESTKRATDIYSCSLLERDLSSFSQSYVNELEDQCKKDMNALAPVSSSIGVGLGV